MNVLKSIGAVLAGLVIIFVLSHATDFPLEKFGIMKLPFSDNPTWFILLVLFYRLTYSVIGCIITATLAPSRGYFHAMILGGIGTVLGTLGLIAMWEQEPKWYPIALIVFAMPCAWLGGKLSGKE
jgi:hypothetical protein